MNSKIDSRSVCKLDPHTQNLKHLSKSCRVWGYVWLVTLYWLNVHVCVWYFLPQWVLLATIKCGNYEKASSILQEKYTDLDLNCQDYVCKLASCYNGNRTSVVNCCHTLSSLNTCHWPWSSDRVRVVYGWGNRVMHLWAMWATRLMLWIESLIIIKDFHSCICCSFTVIGIVHVHIG